jgi:hypothetical protein
MTFWSERLMSNDFSFTRRGWIARMMGVLVGGGMLSALRPTIVSAVEKPVTITVYKDPSCGCCTKWVTHLQKSGFATRVQDRPDMDALKDSLGVPSALRSCHTAVAGRFVIEGHVPAQDVERLLSSAPAGVVGLAAPGMPVGAPGMEMGARADKYDVIAFTANGATHVFAHH